MLEYYPCSIVKVYVEKRLMDGSNSVSIVILNLEATAEKESMFARDLSLKKNSKE